MLKDVCSFVEFKLAPNIALLWIVLEELRKLVPKDE
jgi:hypothetical protein